MIKEDNRLNFLITNCLRQRSLRASFSSPVEGNLTPQGLLSRKEPQVSRLMECDGFSPIPRKLKPIDIKIKSTVMGEQEIYIDRSPGLKITGEDLRVKLHVLEWQEEDGKTVHVPVAECPYDCRWNAYRHRVLATQIDGGRVMEGTGSDVGVGAGVDVGA